jgi:hypothetical protein
VIFNFGRRAAAFALAAALAAIPAVAQRQSPVPWVRGEFLEYSVNFSIITAGSGRMSVVGIDTVRGRAAWHLRFNITGGLPLFGCGVNDNYDSWVDVETLNSLRFHQHLSECGNKHVRLYEIFPERSMFQLEGKEESPSVPDPLDDAAFLFFVRSIPLEVGKDILIPRYFDPKGNPVLVKVLRKESVRVDAGVFPSIVLQPIIKTSGLFGEGGHAEIWLSDDQRHILLQMKVKLNFGSLSLYLKKATFPDSAAPTGKQ